MLCSIKTKTWTSIDTTMKSILCSTFGFDMNPKVCDRCDKTPVTLSSARCKAVVYCSTEFQKLDEEIHKVLCRGSTAFERHNPRPASHLSLLLPDYQKSPRWVWVNPGGKGRRLDISEHVFECQASDEPSIRNAVISCGTYSVEIIAADPKFRDGSKEKPMLNQLVE